MSDVIIIAAISENNVIGNEGGLPWKLKDDLRLFSNITKGHSVIMGRKNYESIGKPLPNRHNIVITRNPKYKADGCDIVESLDRALFMANSAPFIIGGAEIYKMAMPLATHFFRTTVHAEVQGDVFFPKTPAGFTEWDSCYRMRYNKDDGNDHDFTFELLKRR